MDGCITHSRLALHFKTLKLLKRENDRLQALFDAQWQPVIRQQSDASEMKTTGDDAPLPTAENGVATAAVRRSWPV